MNNYDLPTCPWCGSDVHIIERGEDEWVRCGNPYCAYESEIVEHIEVVGVI